MSWKLSRTLSEASYCKKEDIRETKQAKKKSEVWIQSQDEYLNVI